MSRLGIYKYRARPKQSRDPLVKLSGCPSCTCKCTTPPVGYLLLLKQRPLRGEQLSCPLPPGPYIGVGNRGWG